MAKGAIARDSGVAFSVLLWPAALPATVCPMADADDGPGDGGPAAWPELIADGAAAIFSSCFVLAGSPGT
jgi:hypothetical protein